MGKLRLRHDTAANWTSINPVLGLGEPGIETDTLYIKVGNGVTAWVSLGYSTLSPAALNAAFVPQATAIPQVTENVAIPIFSVQPKTAGFEPFQVQENSFSNIGGGAGTYNHAVHIGWNASRHSGGAGTVAGHASIYMGFEDNYYDSVGDHRYGVEWYVGYASPDGTTVPVTLLRPFYTRVFSDTNVASSATTFMEIGTDGTGSWQVRITVGEPLLYISPTAINLSKDTTVQAPNFALAPTSGQALFLIDSPVAPVFRFRNGGANAWAFQSVSVNALTLYDKSDRANLAFTYGATAAAASLAIGAAVKIGGTTTATDTVAPTSVDTGNLGTSPPTTVITAGSNATRGRVEFGTGTTPAAGGLVTLTFPAGSFTATPRVALTAESFATASKQPYASILNSTQLQIAFGATPAASQAASTYLVSYMVIG